MKVFFSLFLVILLVPAFGQIPDSLADLQFLADSNIVVSSIDTTAEVSRKGPAKALRKFFKSNYPNPTKAALFTFFVPGLGQAYNKKYWKVPIVYTGVGTMVFLIGKNTQNYNRWKTAYRLRVDGDDTTIDEFVNDYPTADRLKTIRDGYRKRREQSYIGLIVMLVLSSADAFVDAHLLKFDVNDDLSMKIKPTFAPVNTQTFAPGLGINIHLAN